MFLSNQVLNLLTNIWFTHNPKLLGKEGNGETKSKMSYELENDEINNGREEKDVYGEFIGHKRDEGGK